MFIAATLALAAPATLDLNKPEQVAEALREAGFQAQVETGSDDEPFIRSMANGATYAVLFFGCEKGKNCTDLQFYASWGTEEKETPAAVNGFNADYRFTRAYIDAEDDPVVEMDVMGVDGKIDTAHFNRSIEVWSELMGLFMAHLDSQ